MKSVFYDLKYITYKICTIGNIKIRINRLYKGLSRQLFISYYFLFSNNNIYIDMINVKRPSPVIVVIYTKEGKQPDKISYIFYFPI